MKVYQYVNFGLLWNNQQQTQPQPPQKEMTNKEIGNQMWGDRKPSTMIKEAWNSNKNNNALSDYMTGKDYQKQSQPITGAQNGQGI